MEEKRRHVLALAASSLRPCLQRKGEAKKKKKGRLRRVVSDPSVGRSRSAVKGGSPLDWTGHVKVPKGVCPSAGAAS